jgi:hypothetical protein
MTLHTAQTTNHCKTRLWENVLTPTLVVGGGNIDGGTRVRGGSSGGVIPGAWGVEPPFGAQTPAETAAAPSDLEQVVGEQQLTGKWAAVSSWVPAVAGSGAAKVLNGDVKDCSEGGEEVEGHRGEDVQDREGRGLIPSRPPSQTAARPRSLTWQPSLPSFRR